jgi:hypothetical protein
MRQSKAMPTRAFKDAELMPEDKVSSCRVARERRRSRSVAESELKTDVRSEGYSPSAPTAMVPTGTRFTAVTG